LFGPEATRPPSPQAPAQGSGGGRVSGAVSLPKRPPSTGPDPDAPPPGAVSLPHPPAPDTHEHEGDEG